MDKPVIIFGAKGLGKVALEIFRSNNIEVYCFLDDDKSLHGTEIDEISVLGETSDGGFLKYIGKKCGAFVAIDETKYRESVVKMIVDKRKEMPMNAVHNEAYLSEKATIGHGNMINAGAVVNTGSKLGNHCVVHAKAVVDYDAVLGDFVHVGAGSNINSGVEIGKSSFIGPGVTIISGVKIGKNANIGAGSVVIKDVKDGEMVFGNPAKPVSADTFK